MPGVIFDTSFLIHFADRSKPFHAAARDFYQACLTKQIPMYLSSVVAGEFEVRQPVSELPLQNFRVLGYETPHAIRAAHLFRLNEKHGPTLAARDRRIISNDLKIAAQAAEEGIRIIVTEDANTLSRIVNRLQKEGLIDLFVLLLSEGYAPERLNYPSRRVFCWISLEASISSLIERSFLIGVAIPGSAGILPASGLVLRR